MNQQISRLVSLPSLFRFPTDNSQVLPPTLRLQPGLGPLETWGFGFSGLLLWLGPAPAMHAALGPQAIWVWLPGVIVGMLLNFQVKRLGTAWSEMAGGTPNYTTRLLKNYPWLAAYSAIGYFFGWAAVPLVNAIILTDLIKANLNLLGIACPELWLKLGFALLAFVVAFSGTRALGILHLFFVIPALGLLLTFCIQGLGWLAWAPTSPGLLPTEWPPFNFVEWAKWFFIIVYAVYACETAACFVVDSQRPSLTLRCLSVTAWLIPVIYLGGSWVLMRLSTLAGTGDNVFLHLLSAATPFWGQSAALLVTFLIATSCLLNCATSVSTAPRILYQLALDGYLSPLFAVVSRKGVLGPALIFTLLLSLTGLLWGDVSRVVMVTGTGYFCSIMATHLGLWLQRGRPEVQWPGWSLLFLVVESVVLVVGGLAWDWLDFMIGLLLPVVILIVDLAIRHLPLPFFQPQWWCDRYRRNGQNQTQDFVAFQVTILLLLVGATAFVTWWLAQQLGNAPAQASSSLFIMLLLSVAYVSIAIACWTSLPQVISIARAREQAERLFISANDAILVLDQDWLICQANPAAERLFGTPVAQILDCPLSQFFSGLSDRPEDWSSCSEQVFTRQDQETRTVEVTIAESVDQTGEEYVVIVRDITARKQVEAALRQSETQLRQQALDLELALQNLRSTQAQLVQTEKMSTLGQLVAGVAHEINNPINFIHGNIIHADQYARDLLALVKLYQAAYPDPVPAIQDQSEAIDLPFLSQDLPKLLSSMQVGTDRIRGIVRSLRNFSRLDESEFKAVDIHEGIDGTLMILQSRLKDRPERPAIQVVKDYGKLPLVECYAGQLNQVFMNILTNAIDALEEQVIHLDKATRNSCRGVITVQTSMADAESVVIEISDNGPGMDEAVQKRLMEPFFTTKPVGKGTGLGMAISYQIVIEKHRGSLQCSSTPGRGSTFKVIIPIQQTRSPAAPQPVSSLPSLTSA